MGIQTIFRFARGIFRVSNNFLNKLRLSKNHMDLLDIFQADWMLSDCPKVIQTLCNYIELPARILLDLWGIFLTCAF